MTWDELSGRSSEMNGRLKEWWGRLIGDDQSIIAGRKLQLMGLVQQRYGATVDEIEQQIGSFERHVTQHR